MIAGVLFISFRSKRYVELRVRVAIAGVRISDPQKKVIE